jgi:hypothetical protein
MVPLHIDAAERSWTPSCASGRRVKGALRQSKARLPGLVLQGLVQDYRDQNMPGQAETTKAPATAKVTGAPCCLAQTIGT